MSWVLLLLLAWSVAAVNCTRLCLAALRAARIDPGIGDGHRLTLYEAAFLSGGPVRVAELAMVSMARQRRLLLAHTGWVTVVDPEGRDGLERSVMSAIGSYGQARIAPVRSRVATGAAVRDLADRLVAAGLAVPEGSGSSLAAAVRRVRATAVGVVVLGVVVALRFPSPGAGGVPVPVWFALPLILTLCSLALARLEAHPYTRWASPAGQRLLGTLATHGVDERTYLTSVAVHGVRAVRDPQLRAAFGHHSGTPSAHRARHEIAD
ncbi:TIGR04222 domain-containing membrane protein [Streptomyces cavernae]|uniref:TIGR04222 domain-containing membrane protein n=1 Tax=Streptomyces cavernae TaxID=2259034 RepID=UPI000FEBD9FC|nr:TIGR04222 domain-containing membrane protein [Streptomyces cavernae]